MTSIVKLDTRLLDRIIAEHEREAGAIVRATAFEIEANAKISMKPGTGREYVRGKGRVHRASAPGHAPAPDTGNLLNTIQAEEGDHALNWRVRDGTDYGLHLELGTIHMAARPFMTPATEKARSNWNKRWREFFKRWRQA